MATAGVGKLTFIIILNWNGWQDTTECVESCLKLTYSNSRILIVDNGSMDGSERELRQRFPELEILQTGSNLGYAGGNNVGIRHALARGAEYIWLLNNDTSVEPEALTSLVEAAETSSDVGIVGSLILHYQQPQTICFAGGYINWRDGSTRHLGIGEPDAGQYVLRRSVDYVSGCSMLLTRACIEKIGLLQKEYFLYYEETDWCARALRAGFKVFCQPASRVYHKESPSTGVIPPVVLYYLIRNRLFFLARNGRGVRWLRRLGEDLRIIPLEIVKCRDMRMLRVRSFVKAYWHWVRGCMGPADSVVRIDKSAWCRFDVVEHAVSSGNDCE